MSDTSGPDAFGGGAHKRVQMPAAVRPVPTYGDERDPGAMADSDKIVEQLKHTMDRQLKDVNKEPSRFSPSTSAPITSPLKEIAQRIKKLVHDDGEQMGDELKAKVTDGVSMAKALQLWADDTLRPDDTNKERAKDISSA